MEASTEEPLSPAQMDIDPADPTPAPAPATAETSDTPIAGPPTTTTAERPLGPDGKPISKSAHKKLLKLQRLAETREQWKADKKRKLKEKKQRDREEREAAAAASTGTNKRKKDDGEDEEDGTQDDEEEQEGEDGQPAGKKLKQKQPAAGAGAGAGAALPTATAGVKRVVEDITLILDCGFDDKMHDKEIVSMSSQLTRCYAFNRAAPRQFKLAVTSLNGRLLARFQNGLSNHHLHWKGITFSDSEYEVTDENRGKLVYLTADSEDTVEDLVPGTSYIIGGIVDRNRYKSLCYNKATAQNIRTAKLPIGDYIKMSSRFVLTTNQVVEIMLKYLECRDWKQAFIAVIPPRKQPVVKPATAKEGADDNDGEKESSVEDGDT
ncbi:uncharacterized protein LAJ45_04361 [Morchella importuna]|uniref:uncharacterized protein n=1 Tax=Morchella importuna TaxID=1174673 RepID=UPI001E8DEF85|nr:uncharacterized protein LAJ45_04361 [Morchella importuna]KAH8151739.1 hypothetical protein LAJ45_04361 [Morchella importuna]